MKKIIEKICHENRALKEFKETVQKKCEGEQKPSRQIMWNDKK